MGWEQVKERDRRYCRSGEIGWLGGERLVWRWRSFVVVRVFILCRCTVGRGREAESGGSSVLICRATDTASWMFLVDRFPLY